jgi:hypothetical protein
MQRRRRYSWRAELDTAVRIGSSSWSSIANAMGECICVVNFVRWCQENYRWKKRWWSGIAKS